MSIWEVEHGPVFSEKNRSRMCVLEGREWPIRTCFMDIKSCPFGRSSMDDSHLLFLRKTGPECPFSKVENGPCAPVLWTYNHVHLGGRAWIHASIRASIHAAGPRRLPEPNVCQAPSLERLRILSQKGCVHKSSGSAPILHEMVWTKQWLRIWLSSSRLLGRGPHKNCKNDLDDQT